VLGLGAAPTDVVFTGDRGVYCEEGDYSIAIGSVHTQPSRRACSPGLFSPWLLAAAFSALDTFLWLSIPHH
jgi:hypothetical protein